MIAPLHGLRGIAALAVLVGHVNPLLDYGISFGPSLGVALFFALSGFLMGYLYLPLAPSPRNIWQFSVARIARVYPLFACAVFASVAVYYVLGVSVFGIGLSDVLPHLLMAGSGLTIWTISVEFQFYAAFLLVWVVSQLLPKARRDAGLLIALAVFVVASFAMGLPEGRIDLLRYFHLFAGGMAGALVWRRYPELVSNLAPIGLPASLAVLAGYFVLVNQFYQHDLVYNDPIASLASICAVVFAVAIPSSRVGEFLSLRGLVWLGEVSFGIYLIHRFAIGAVGFTPLGHLPRFVQLGGVLALTLFVAWIANLIVERPARELIRRAGLALYDFVAGRASSLKGF